MTHRWKKCLNPVTALDYVVSHLIIASGTQGLTVNHRIATPPSSYKSRFYCVCTSVFSDLAQICSDTSLRDSWHKSGQSGNVSVNNNERFISLINSLVVSACLFLRSLIAGKASPKGNLVYFEEIFSERPCILSQPSRI